MQPIRHPRTVKPMGSIASRVERQLRYAGMTPAQRRRRRVLAVTLSLAIAVLAAELGLRLAGLRVAQMLPREQLALCEHAVRSLNTRLATDAFVADRFLLWKMMPGSNVGGREVNSLGAFGPLPSARKTSTTVRVLCLGDSVLALTYRTFPEIAARFCSWARIPHRFEIIDASVVGYSSEQVLRRFRQLRRLQPDLVLVCVGWNDHSPSLALPDCLLGYQTVVSAYLQRMFYPFRVYQLLSASPSARATGASPAAPFMARVPQEQFEQNLRTIVREVRRSGGEVLFATQPWADPLHGSGTDRSSDTLTMRLHRWYNDIVRRVAATERAPLMDLEEEFNRRNRARLFEPDGIHLNGPGHNVAARLLIGALRNYGFLSPVEFDAIVERARYDTTAPDRSRAAWAVEPSRADITISQPLTLSVVVQNIGNTTWLREHRIPRYGVRRHVSYGSVEIFARWVKQELADLDGASVMLPHDIYPGESTSKTLVLQPVGHAGQFTVEIGLRASELGELLRYGTEVTTVPVTVRLQ